MLHGKGVTIVVPDKMWPQDNDAQWVWSTEDMKVHSSWTDGRRRDRLAPRMDTVGSLRVKEIFPPGALMALPINELKKRDADCDGDKVFLYAGLPRMTQAVTRFFEEREQRIGKLGSFKPPKTAHGVLDAEGRYQAGRAAEVLSALHGQELVGRLSTLQFLFFGQPPALQQTLAERTLFGVYEGTERELRRGVRALLRGERATTPQVMEDLLLRAAWASSMPAIRWRSKWRGRWRRNSWRSCARRSPRARRAARRGVTSAPGPVRRVNPAVCSARAGL